MDFKTVLKVILIIFAWGAVGGGIAFIGNHLGRYIGRKKMSIFKLRPRYTSMLFTILSGMVIAGLTLGLAMLLSEPVRITIINPKEYKDMQQKYEEMRKYVEKTISTGIVYKNQDLIVSAVIKADPDATKMESALKEIVAASNKAAIDKSTTMAQTPGMSFTTPEGGRLVGYVPDNLAAVARELSRLKGEYVIFSRARQNALLDQQFFVELGNPLPNQLIFRRGELLEKTTIDGKQSYATVLQMLTGTIKGGITRQAIYKGVFPNPEDGSVGEYDEKQIQTVAEEIKRRNGPVTIGFYAAEDIFLRGPLKLNAKILSE